MTGATDWKAEARRMRDEDGMSERDIAKLVGKAPSSVHEALKQESNGHAELDAERLAALAGDSSGDPTPGQLDIDGGETPAQPYVEEIRVDGSTQLSLVPSFGGKKPQSATIVLRGGQYELLDGKAFAKDETIEFSGTAKIRAISQVDKVDSKTGVVVTCKQVHVAVITDLQVK